MSKRATPDRRAQVTHEALSQVWQARPMRRAVRLVGFWSAALATFGAVACAVAQPLTDRPLTAPPPAWHGLAAYAVSFDPTSLTWLHPAFLPAVAFVVLASSIIGGGES
jgi:hypothetical protein